MILVDTPVWMDHLRSSDARLVELLRHTRVGCHPWIVGELALGHLADRERIVRLLHSLPMTSTVTPSESLHFLSVHALHARGIGYVDLHCWHPQQ